MNNLMEGEVHPVSRERLNVVGEPPPRHAVNLVSRGRVDTYIAITAEGDVIASNGHVDLGTGIQTAFAQIVAEELDVELQRVRMVLGDTDRTPDQVLRQLAPPYSRRLFLCARQRRKLVTFSFEKPRSS